MTQRPAAPLVLPSLAAADLLGLGGQIDALMDAGATWFHVDVMDGHFVPNLALGSDLARQIADRVHARGGAIDVHLMVERPGAMVERFAPFADAVSVHIEADPHPHRLLARIRELDCAAGIAVNPGTSLSALDAVAGSADFILVMGVNPGFSGQSFIPETTERVAAASALTGSQGWVEVDGGVSATNARALSDAGATWLVSASSVFGADEPVAAYGELDRLVR